MAAVQHRATTRTSNTDNSTTKTKSKATSARKSPATKRKRVSAETARAAAALKGLAVEAPAPSIEANEPGQFGRINVMDITPAEERGIFPARVELGEPFEMTAQVFIEGRTKVGATAIVRNPRGKETMRRAMTCVNPGLDRWTVMVKCGEHSDLKPWEDGYAAVKRQLGEWTVTIEGWEDAYVSWLHDARIKVRVMDDVDNALNSGAELLARWAETPDTGLTARDRKTLEKAAETMADQTLSAEDRLAAGDNPTIAALHETHPLRDGISPSQPQRFKVERPKSSFAAWYQFFPRSEGATIDPNTGKIIQGTLKTSMAGLERAAAEGFDIVYLPPVFPIGVTNRKGRNNTLVAGPDDPGSPFGIGSELGGHDTVDPLLGTMDDFKALCQRAHELGLEIALDFALQCSPDHPWVKAHPNWFRHKPDGSIAFAENPPKKYQDIYPIDFNADIAGFNSNRFDVPVLVEEFLRAGIDIDLTKRKFVDVQVIYHKLEQRTLSAAYKFYCGKNLEDAHTAEADTRATYEVLKAQLDHYPDVLQNDINYLSEYSSYSKNVDFAGRIVYDDNGVEVFNFGKYKGIPVSEVLKKDLGYYGWIMNGDFTLNTKNVLTKIRLRETGLVK